MENGLEFQRSGSQSQSIASYGSPPNGSVAQSEAVFSPSVLAINEISSTLLSKLSPKTHKYIIDYKTFLNPI